MGKGVEFEGMNVIYQAPPGQEDRCNSIGVFRNGLELVTCWELTDEELADVIRTKRVWFLMQSGGKLYPHFIGSERTVHALMADTGAVWKLSESATPPKPEPCEYCLPGMITGLPGNACENCMNTGLKYPTAKNLER
jgi:hypothetical protein